MEFTSITEYFYKFSSRVTTTLLPTILLYISLYLIARSNTLVENPDFKWIVAGCVLIIWTVSYISLNKKIKSARNGQGLRAKLEKYFTLTIVRYSIFAFCAILFCAGYYFTGDQFFSFCFLIQLLLCAFHWPRSPKVANDLRLRGDEREMVYYKKDKF